MSLFDFFKPKKVFEETDWRNDPENYNPDADCTDEEYDTDDLDDIEECRCYRHICNGVMRRNGDYWKCSSCGAELYHEYWLDWQNGILDPEIDDHDIGSVGGGYIQVRDENGNPLECDCGKNWIFLKCSTGQYVCPYCDTVLSRKEVLNAIGADLPLQRCEDCDQDYPYCKEYCEYLETE